MPEPFGGAVADEGGRPEDGSVHGQITEKLVIQEDRCEGDDGNKNLVHYILNIFS